MPDAPKAKCAEGAPAWVMTFADLMSLLMCFFVLLLSFSEMDVSKYKEMAGSLKNAFGVQRDIKVRETPKGINVIAREFSPGRPEPTHLNVIRQFTTNDMRINLDLGKERHRPVPTPKNEPAASKEKTFKPGEVDRKSAQTSGLSAAQQKDLAEAKALAEKRLEEKLRLEKAQQGMQEKQRDAGVTIDDKSLDELVKARAAAERKKKLEASARLISSALGKEIKAGSVDVETAGQKIIIRVREKASFGSGRAELKDGFKPILARVATILKDSNGKIIVAGHTDNLPIFTERFRSNWELSSARAVSVAHAMMLATDIPPDRFLIQGYADTEPMVANDSSANRAKNRRVEIILQQGDDKVSDAQIGGSDARASKRLPARPVSRQTAAKIQPAARVSAVQAANAPNAGTQQTPGSGNKPSSSLGIRAGGQ